MIALPPSLHIAAGGRASTSGTSYRWIHLCIFHQHFIDRGMSIRGGNDPAGAMLDAIRQADTNRIAIFNKDLLYPGYKRPPRQAP